MAVLAVVSAVGMAVDDRVLVGSPIWFKPFKFSVSFAAYSLSLAWMLSLLPRARRTGWWAGTVVAVASAIEMVAITGQVVRGTRSHFNNTTPFDETVYQVMANTVVVLWTATLVIAVLMFRSALPDRASSWAVRCGSLLALAGAALGFLMTLPTAEQQRTASTIVGAHSVGVPDGGPSMPLTGWSTTGGDLRVPHFFGMHALQLLPLFLLLTVALAPRVPALRDAGTRLRLVLVASGGYAALLALLTWQALRGQSLVHPDGTTVAALGAIALVTLLATALVLRRSPARRADADTAVREPESVP
ncbi:hypothetical protein ABT160_18305 [Streptomyces sp. NPDC001941]|uniref:hypothetical protein n=1 Tax=Streptomyces sp. NPDC001941 TaxID=3154659 RepID=UPI0033176FBF